MLININPSGDVAKLDGRAHIVISFDDDGATTMRAFFNGRRDSFYAAIPDARLFEREVPKLVAELRAQIQSIETGVAEPQVTTQGV